MKMPSLILTLILTAAASAQNPAENSRYSNLPDGGILNRGPLPDLDAFTAEGEPLKLRELCRGRYTVLTAGCLTCPLFHQNYPEIEAAFADYAPEGVQFFYFYKSLRHPELGGYIQPQNISERLLQLAEARRQLGTQVPWIADTMDDSMRIGLKAGSWSTYLIAPSGEIIYAADRIDAAGLRRALTKAVGAPARTTRPEDLSLPRIQRPAKLVNTDSELGVKRPEGLSILAITPAAPEETYYVKLRAEADDALLSTGTGRLFLGFYPDPIHDAHWNNLTPPMKYTLTLPGGASAEPAAASAKKGPGDSDTLPRQFWVDVSGATPGGSIKLKLDYFGCAPGLCMALTHEYTVQIKAAGDGSRTYGMNRGRKNARTDSSGNRLARMDVDQDGAVSFDEMCTAMIIQRGADFSEQQARQRFDSIDTDNDGSISAAELEKAPRRQR